MDARRLTPLLLAMISIGVGCGPHAAPGHLADVSAPSIVIVDTQQYPERGPSWLLLIGNHDARGGCLELGEDLEIEVDGVHQAVLTRGRMERPARAVFGDWSCASASARLDFAADPTRDDTVVVRDQTKEMRATFPPIFARLAFAEDPPVPDTAVPGQAIVFRLQPAPRAPLRVAFIPRGSMSVSDGISWLELAEHDDGTFTVTLPPDLAPGTGELFITEIGEVRADGCVGARDCMVSLQSSVGRPLRIDAR